VDGLVVKRLAKAYPGGHAALQGVDLRVGPDEFVSLIGRSGAGKSTLLRCINRLVEPDSGEVFVDGIEVTRLDKRKLREARRSIGMIFQEFNLVEQLSVIDNVLCGCLGFLGTWRSLVKRFGEEDVERARALIDKVGLTACADKRADELSGGQRQRVGIARALVQKPRLLLIDEPTSSLDPVTGKEIMTLLREVAREVRTPVLLSSHNLEVAEAFSDRTIALKAGQKVYDGPPGAMNLERVY
jgi:phosphonate transport system ATP-binding protein